MPAVNWKTIPPSEWKESYPHARPSMTRTVGRVEGIAQL